MEEGKAIAYAAAIVVALSTVIVFLFKIYYNTITGQQERTQTELESEKVKRENSDEKLNQMVGKMEATIEARNLVASLPDKFDQLHKDIISHIKEE